MHRPYKHLSLEERRHLARWRDAGMPVAEIADRLGRDPSTLHREIRRNTYRDDELPELNGYHPVNAQAMYDDRRAVHLKLVRHPNVRDAVLDRLKAGWSPEQIAGRMKLEDHPVRVSHQTIYRFAYSKTGRAQELFRQPARRSITFDRGTEFTAWTHLKAGIGAATWFCDPQAPWQKGTVENTNRRLRRYLTRQADPSAFTNRYLRSIRDRLNAQPRKCLGFRTPAKVFREKLMEIARAALA